MLCVSGVFSFFQHLRLLFVVFINKEIYHQHNPSGYSAADCKYMCYTDEASVLVVLDGDLSGRQQAVHVGLGSILPRRQTLQAVVCTYTHDFADVYRDLLTSL